MDQISRALLTVGGGITAPTYADDVFATYLYTGNGNSTQTINNGINLLDHGGLVWTKSRNSTENHRLNANPAGSSFVLRSNTTDALVGAYSCRPIHTSTGYTLDGTSGGIADINTLNNTYTSWTFRKASKFFDVVTYTGDGASNRAIAHSLGCQPGMVVVKNLSSASNWQVRHYGTETGSYFPTGYWSSRLNGTIEFANTGLVRTSLTGWTSSFFVGESGSPDDSNLLGNNYVAYLFAHDTAADGLIQCGSFATDGSGNASVTSLSWEPQFLLVKASSTTGDWIMLDSMRGWNMTTADARMLANNFAAETTAAETGNPTATGFDFKGGSASATYVYMAIRRPNKPPTTGTSVFNLGTSTAATDNIAPGTPGSSASSTDLVMLADRGTNNLNFSMYDRLRGFQSTSSTTPDTYTSPRLITSATSVEAISGTQVFQRSGLSGLQDRLQFSTNSITSKIGYVFKRAPGFFDVVCYTGNGSNSQSVNHSLGTVPELMIVKARATTGGVENWQVYHSLYGPGFRLYLNTTDGVDSQAAAANTWGLGGIMPTSSLFYVGDTSANSNPTTSLNGALYIAYLFATLPGVSKVGSYTGNGTNQTVGCGFTTGARFVLIRRSDATGGDWYVWDTARGIVAANDPHLSLNSTAVEVTTNDSVDPDNSGFIVNQVAATNINVSSATYIYLAIA